MYFFSSETKGSLTNLLETVLRVNSIVKTFGDLTAVNHLSFDVKKGEIFALLGPNGAGKTTAVRMLMNIIRPDEGRIEFYLNGLDKSQVPLSSQLGYLPEERGLYQEIPIIKTLEFMGVIRGLDKIDARKSSEEWLTKLDLLDRKSEKLSVLSKGNQQKIQFISSVLHNPLFAILDEPFAGFDPINQEAFLQIINELRDKGTTILLSAHQMHLVEKIADKVLLINNGKNIAYGTVDEIKRESSTGEILILTYEDQPEFSFLQNDDAVEKSELNKEGEIRIHLRQNKSLSGLLSKAASNLKITSVKTEQITLHDVFIDKVNKDKKGNDE
ncbi:MAG: ATP-binding cassette domain-containing protein [Melioribacteraceae bacterium]|nr:ATP-binding cassette domain-containing protein [Melioribacteraceae bacterium]